MKVKKTSPEGGKIRRAFTPSSIGPNLIQVYSSSLRTRIRSTHDIYICVILYLINIFIMCDFIYLSGKWLLVLYSESSNYGFKL